MRERADAAHERAEEGAGGEGARAMCVGDAESGIQNHGVSASSSGETVGGPGSVTEAKKDGAAIEEKDVTPVQEKGVRASVGRTEGSAGDPEVEDG